MRRGGLKSSPESNIISYAQVHGLRGGLLSSRKILLLLLSLFLPLLSACGESPTEPMSLVANAVSPTEIGLSWEPSTDNVGVVTYGIYRDGAHLKYTPETSSADTGLKPLTAYCYRVSAFDEAWNESSMSNESCATTHPDTEPPSVPQGLIANAVSPIKVELSWEASTDNVALAGYNVFRDGGLVTTSGSEEAQDEGVLPSTRYCYRVSAFDGAGNTSAQSEESCAETPAD